MRVVVYPVIRNSTEEDHAVGYGKCGAFALGLAAEVQSSAFSNGPHVALSQQVLPSFMFHSST